MFDFSICEINCHPIPDDIVVYRYIPKTLIKKMLEWGSSKTLKRNSILADKGFFAQRYPRKLSRIVTMQI